jgi:lysophospholipase L1-like esterase
MRIFRKLLTGVLLALLLAGVALAALEGGLRLASRLSTGAWPETRESRFRAELGRALALYRRHPYLNTAPREGAHAEAFGKRASFNSLGYRSPERPLAKPAGAVRVVCLGGSTTFDLLAADDAATWPALLERALRGRGLPVEVWNAGFPGWTSLENLISFEVRDGELAPDLVVLFQGVNDLQPAAHRPFDPSYEHGHAELAVRALGFELGPPTWLDRSLLAERLRDLAGRPEDPWSRLGPGPAGPRQRRIAAAAPAAFERNVRALAAAAATRGARLAVVTQHVRLRRPSLAADRAYLAQWVPGLEPDAAPGELERFNNVLRALGRDGTAVLLDAAAEAGWQDADYADPLHFSAAGSEKLARYLAARLPALLPASAGQAEP